MYKIMKCSIFKKSALVLIGMFVFSLAGLNAQTKSKVFNANEIVQEKLGTIQAKLDLTADQVTKIQAIDLDTERRLEASPNNTASRKIYEWRDGQYRGVLSAAQFRTYVREKQAIVDAAQAAWCEKNGTPVEVD